MSVLGMSSEQYRETAYKSEKHEEFQSQIAQEYTNGADGG
jgi:hypothetical protein